MRSEEGVLRFLRSLGLKKIVQSKHIEIDCAEFWRSRGVCRSSSTWKRAFQRLVASGQLGSYEVEYASDRAHTATHKLAERVTKKTIEKAETLPHGRR